MRKYYKFFFIYYFKTNLSAVKITDGDLQLQDVIRNVQIDYVCEVVMDDVSSEHTTTTQDYGMDGSSSDNSSLLEIAGLNDKDKNLESLMNDALHEFEFNEADVDTLLQL